MVYGSVNLTVRSRISRQWKTICLRSLTAPFKCPVIFQSWPDLELLSFAGSGDNNVPGAAEGEEGPGPSGGVMALDPALVPVAVWG
jgi:hypothetical protein